LQGTNALAYWSLKGSPQKLVGVFLSAVDHVLADGLELLVDPVWLDAVQSEGVAEGLSHGAQDAVLGNVIKELILCYETVRFFPSTR
jgi:hypothetical protein